MAFRFGRGYGLVLRHWDVLVSTALHYFCSRWLLGLLSSHLTLNHRSSIRLHSQVLQKRVAIEQHLLPKLCQVDDVRFFPLHPVQVVLNDTERDLRVLLTIRHDYLEAGLDQTGLQRLVLLQLTIGLLDTWLTLLDQVEELHSGVAEGVAHVHYSVLEGFDCQDLHADF